MPESVATTSGTALPPPASAAHSFHWTFGLVAGLALMGAIAIVGIVAPFILQGAADNLSSATRMPPSFEHPFGTDEFGRDMLARSLVATRLTLIMTTAATAITVVFGVLLGAGIWLAQRKAREFALRVLEVAVSYPGLLVALIIISTMGAGVVSIVIGVGVAGIPSFARLTATLASDLSRRDFMTTARLLGVPGWKVITRHMLPNMAEPMLILAATGFAGALGDLSGLSFIGLGVQTPDYDFGRLLNDALPAIYTRPAQVLGPGLMIILTILAAMLIGDGLAAAADPRTARRWHKRIQRPARSTASDPHTSEALVSVDGLKVSTDTGVELLHGLSFTIARGEILGVVGESGSGKTLTAMALAQLLPGGMAAEANELRIGDMDMLGRVPGAQLARALALVHQDPGTTFRPGAPDGHPTHRGAPHSPAQVPGARPRSILGALRTVRITEPEKRLHQHPYEFSGGMLQRAMIAAALASEPQLIIADEPTTSLDVTVQARSCGSSSGSTVSTQCRCCSFPTTLPSSRCRAIGSW